jgi:hypothetical protein
MVPFRTIAYGQQRLIAAIAHQPDRLEHLDFGFLLHPRREPTGPILGIITLQGESMPLTPTLLQALSGQDLLLSGKTRVELGPVTPIDPTANGTPLTTILLTVLPEPDEVGDAAVGLPLLGIEALIAADTLLHPIVLLMSARPAGWPR